MQLPRPLYVVFGSCHSHVECKAASVAGKMGQREIPYRSRVARAEESTDPLSLFCFVLINKAGKMPVINVFEEYFGGE